MILFFSYSPLLPTDGGDLTPISGVLQEILFPEYVGRDEGQKLDSLHVRVVGRSSFAFFTSVAADQERNLVFGSTGDKLYVFDVANPANPGRVKHSLQSFPMRSLYYKDAILFTAGSEGGVRMLDFSDPSRPVILGTLETPGYAMDVWVSGEYAFVAGWSDGLLVYSIQDPVAPELVGWYDGIDMANSVTVSGNVAFATNGSLHAVDITDPTAPVLLGIHETDGWAMDVAIDDTLAYIADGAEGLEVVDVADPALAEPLGRARTFGYTNAVARFGEYVLIADWDWGLRVISVSDPTSPEEIGFYDTPGYARDVAAIGSSAVVADDTHGLRIVSLSDPAYPEEVSSFETPIDAKDVAVTGGYAYVADGKEGLKVISMADPADPVVIGSYRPIGDAEMITVTGSYAIVFDDDDHNFMVISVEDPTEPEPVSSFYPASRWYVYDVDAQGDYVYIANYGEGLRIVSIEYPSYPSEVGFLDRLGSDVLGLSVEGPFAYLVGYGYDFSVVSIETPENPVLIASLESDITEKRVVAKDSFAYVTGGSVGLSVISIEDPASPFEIGSYEVADSYYEHLAVGGGYAYIAEEDGPLHVISLEDPSSPAMTGFYDPAYSFVNIEADQHYVYLPIQRGGLLVLECYGATSIESPEHDGNPALKTCTLSQNYPNPLNPETTIEVTISDDHAKLTTLAVYDLRGRLVKTLKSGMLAPGRYRFVWDGKDDRGVKVKSGIYFTTLQREGAITTRKMAVAR
ncbi:MAG: FlgD immunoglobulin-like domain containing protein [Candidatus Glassbacteria bacterium]